jgi:hypothetical protein
MLYKSPPAWQVNFIYIALSLIVLIKDMLTTNLCLYSIVIRLIQLI